MHEYAIVQSLIERVEQEARARRATAVHGLQVRVGEVSGVEIELLAKAFETFRAASLCERAELSITAVPARWKSSRAAAPPGSTVPPPTPSPSGNSFPPAGATRPWVPGSSSPSSFP